MRPAVAWNQWGDENSGHKIRIMREGFLRSSANSRAFARGRNGVSSWNSIPSQFYQKTFERRPRRPAEFGAVREFMRLYPHIYPALLHDPRSDHQIAGKLLRFETAELAQHVARLARWAPSTWAITQPLENLATARRHG